jgi:hypothetical protein
MVLAHGGTFGAALEVGGPALGLVLVFLVPSLARRKAARVAPGPATSGLEEQQKTTGGVADHQGE